MVIKKSGNGKRGPRGPRLKPHERRIRKTFTLPVWLLTWLKKNCANQSETIEDALIKQHNLKPPKGLVKNDAPKRTNKRSTDN